MCTNKIRVNSWFQPYYLSTHYFISIVIYTNNGPEFANKNALAYLGERNVEWRHGPSHTPEAQGLVERLVKTLKEEWLMWKEPTDTIELQSCLEEFKTWYNEMRDHSALNYQVPQEVY